MSRQALIRSLQKSKERRSALLSIVFLFVSSSFHMFIGDAFQIKADEASDYLHSRLVALSSIPQSRPFDVGNKVFDDLTEVEKRMFLANVVAYSKSIGGFNMEYEKYPISTVAEPLFSKEASLFETIQEAARSATYFPVSSLYAYCPPQDCNPLRVRLTYERFIPFYRFREAAYNASEEEIKDCLARLNEFSDREKAFALSAFHIYLIKNRYLPQDRFADVFAGATTISEELRKVRPDNEMEDIATLYFNKTTTRMEDRLVKDLENSIDAYCSSEAIVFDSKYASENRSRFVLRDELSKEEIEEFYKSIQKLCRQIRDLIFYNTECFEPHVNVWLSRALYQDVKEWQDESNDGCFPSENYFAVLALATMETSWVLHEDDYRYIVTDPDKRSELRLIRSFFANQTPASDLNLSPNEFPMNFESPPSTLGDLVKALVEQRDYFKKQTARNE